MASLKNHLVELFLDSISRLESLSVRLEEGQERHDVVLRSHVAHGVECAHEAEGSLHLPLCELPVLFEQEEREDSGDAFTSETKGELAFVGVVGANLEDAVFLLGLGKIQTLSADFVFLRLLRFFFNVF